MILLMEQNPAAFYVGKICIWISWFTFTWFLIHTSLLVLLLEIWEEWDALPTSVRIRRDPLFFLAMMVWKMVFFSFQKDVYFWPSISNFSKNSPKKSIQQKSPPKNIHNNHFQQNSTNISPKLNTHPSPQKNIPGILPGRASLCIVARCRCRHRGSWPKLKMARGMKQWNWLSQWLTLQEIFPYPTEREVGKIIDSNMPKIREIC